MKNSFWGFVSNLRFIRLLFLSLILLGGACVPTRVVKTIPKGELDISAGLGGPLIAYHNLTIPIPLTNVAAAYGIRDGLTGFAGLHTTSLLFGVIQTDIGITKNILEQKGWQPGITVSPVANLMFDTWQHHFKLYPDLDINLYWNYRQKQNYVYAGMFNWFELASTRAFNEPQPRSWLPGFQAGHTWERKIMKYTIEAKYIAPFTSKQNIVVDYKSFGNSGAIGLYFGIARKF